MATRKMTFTIPQNLATQFLRRVPTRDRSRYVTKAISARLQEHEEQMIKSCQAANENAGVLEIEKEWDGLADPADRVDESWNG